MTHPDRHEHKGARGAVEVIPVEVHPIASRDDVEGLRAVAMNVERRPQPGHGLPGLDKRERSIGRALVGEDRNLEPSELERARLVRQQHNSATRQFHDLHLRKQS